MHFIANEEEEEAPEEAEEEEEAETIKQNKNCIKLSSLYGKCNTIALWKLWEQRDVLRCAA